MKHLPFLALMLVLFAGIFACNQPGSPSNGPANVQVTPDPNPGHYPLMDPVKANEAKLKWDQLRGVLVNTLKGINVPNDTNFVARGFHVPFNDLKRILDNIGDTTQLFAMLAIQDSAGIPGKPMISLIFQAPDKSPKGTIQYYDFTKPCPTNCPNVSR